MTINERIMTAWDGDWEFRLRTVAAPSEDDEYGWLWFIAPMDHDRWLIFVSSSEDSDTLADEIASEIKTRRTLRMCLFVGEPWSIIEPAPRAVADSQSDFMHAISLKTYTALMRMTPEEVLEQRGFDEAQAIEDLTGGSGGVSMN